MRNSLRWRLQFWYGLVLVAVVAGFAALLYLEVRRSRFREVDSELMAASNYLDSDLRRWPRFELEGVPPTREFHPKWDAISRGEFPKGGFPKWDELPKGDFPKSDRDRDREREGPQGKGPRGGLPLVPRERLFAELIPAGWNETPPNINRGYGVWRTDGSVLRTQNVPDRWPQEGLGISASEPLTLNVGDDRVVVRLGPSQTLIAVRWNVSRIHTELRAFAGRLVLTGAAVLVVGLLGGFWMSSQVVRPIRRMTATASHISATNLSERLDTRGVDAELAELAVVLNGTFKRLETAFGQLTQFTADASHELRTPLAVMRSHVELALSRPRSTEEYRKTLETVLRSVTRMTGIVDGLLTLARADAGRLELLHQPVDLAQLVNEAVQQLRPIAREKDVQLAVELVPLSVSGDSVALARVVANLIENAIRYNKPGGKVTVKLSVRGGQASVSIKDTGIGIPPTDRPHIFERFYRVDAARSREKGGVGLGLAICKTIAEVHGGSIIYRPRTREGSEFRLLLPQIEKSAASSEAETGSEEIASP